MAILVFLIILTFLVLIHEAGHFFVAKKLGIKVEEFGFGFPPRLFAKKIGETVYSLNWLPIGGFVKLYGEDEAGGGKLQIRNPKTENRKADIEKAFFARPAWQRAAVVVAGVVMNFILAVVIISYIFGVSGVATPGEKVLVVAVSPESPAQKAGLVPGDVIEKIDGAVVKNPTQLTDFTSKHLGEKITLEVRTKNSQLETLQITPRKNYPAGQGPMGVAISQNTVLKKYPWYQAPVVGTLESLKRSWIIIAGLGLTLFQLFTKAQVPAGVAGPVGIAELTGQFVQIGPIAVLDLVSFLSINLAILNILPIPALDGGRLFFILIEAVTGRKVNPKYEGYAHAVGMAVLLALIALITFHDVLRIINGQPLLPK